MCFFLGGGGSVQVFLVFVPLCQICIFKEELSKHLSLVW